MRDPDAVKERLFARLQAVYDELDALQLAHNRTPWKCQRSGNCCQVGLTIHEMECAWIAVNLEAEFASGAKDRAKVVGDLTRAFDDPTWTNGNIVGTNWCSLFDGGCSAYPYRPAICRMYGVLIAPDEWCPRDRLSNGRDFLYVDPRVDDLVRRYYAVLDEWGRRFPKEDHTVYYARGVLERILPEEDVRALRKATPPKFWKRDVGYRTQYVTSKQVSREWKKADASLLKNVMVR